MPDKKTPTTDKPSAFNAPPAIHTMQQDLAKAPRPSRFELRHQRALPPSRHIEDLRLKPPVKPLPLPSPSPKAFLPPPQPSNFLTSPLFLWATGLILFAILLLIIIAIIATL